MTVYRHADPRFPFLWESAGQPPARWHGPAEGPVQYFADTPDGAWAEFLRHEGITNESELVNVRRALWAIEVPDDLNAAAPKATQAVLTGGLDTYEECQQEARRLRSNGAAACEHRLRHCFRRAPADGKSKEVCGPVPDKTEPCSRLWPPAGFRWLDGRLRGPSAFRSAGAGSGSVILLAAPFGEGQKP
jgi:hypothetical protein